MPVEIVMIVGAVLLLESAGVFIGAVIAAQKKSTVDQPSRPVTALRIMPARRMMARLP